MVVRSSFHVCHAIARCLCGASTFEHRNWCTGFADVSKCFSFHKVCSYRWKGVVWRNLEKGSELENFIDSISKLQLDICVYY